MTLVTGASTGIGRELAKLSAERGRGVVLLARSEDKLAALGKELQASHGVHVETLVQDLSVPGAVEATFDAIRAKGIEVDRLINNAGFGSLGAFHEAELETELEMLRLNVVALTELTHRFLGPMIARGRGRVLNVASTAAFQPGPFMAVYYASKAYVLSFSEAVAEELRGTGVTVTALCPGPTRTEFQARAHMESSALLRLGMQDARSVATVGFRAMEKGKVVAIPGLTNRLAAWSVRFSPRAAVRRVVRRLNLGN